MCGKGKKPSVGFCVPQTSLPTSLASVPYEGPVWSPACLGLRGSGAYVRLAVSPGAPCTGSPATVGVQCPVPLLLAEPVPSASRHGISPRQSPVQAALLSVARFLSSGPGSNTRLPSPAHTQSFARPATHTSTGSGMKENLALRSASAVYQLCGLEQVKRLEPRLAHL